MSAGEHPHVEHLVEPPALRVSKFDQVASLFVASFSMIGGAVLILFIIWLTTVLTWTTPPPPMQLLNYEGRGDHPEGFEYDDEPPGLEELPEVAEPTLAASLEAVTDALSTQAASFDVTSTNLAVSSGGTGMGDKRQPGPLGMGEKLVHPSDRWEMRFNSTSLQVYSQQLDFFGIQLCAYGGGVQTIDYVSKVSQGSPTVVKLTEPPKGDQGVFFTWRGGQLLNYDKQLLAKAGITLQGRVLTQYYPVELRGRMEQMEADFSKKEPITWLKTIWVVEKQGNRWEMKILDMYFRPAPPK